MGNNPYLPKLSPTVGNGVPGLPRRKDPVPITEWEDIPYMVSVGVFDTSSQATTANELSISPNGRKFYLFDKSLVFEYDLQVPFDITSAVYTGNSKDLTVGTDPDLEGFDISSDGTKIYVVGDTATETIYEWNLSTAFDVTTAALSGDTRTVDGQTATPRNLVVSFDGSFIFIADANNADLFQYTMSTPFDLSTATFTRTKSFSFELGTTASYRFNKEGTFLAISDAIFITVYSAILTTPWDISTATVSPKAVKPLYNQMNAMAMSFDTDNVYTFDNVADEIEQFSVS